MVVQVLQDRHYGSSWCVTPMMFHIHSHAGNVDSKPHSCPWQQVGLVEGECIPSENNKVSVLLQSRVPPSHTPIVYLREREYAIFKHL